MINRFALHSLSNAMSDTPVVLVLGPRQVGKSTLVKLWQGMQSHASFVTLDDLSSLEFARRDPAAFLKAFEPPLIIDEIQRVPELLLAIKAQVDESRSPGRFLLTGSANVLTSPKVADSLAGRMEIVELGPLTQGEIEGCDSSWLKRFFQGQKLAGPPVVSELAERLLRGGFPEPFQRKTASRRTAWFENYMRSLLERDVREVANIEGLVQLPRLLNVIASRCGETVNVTALSRDTGIAPTTLTRYLDLLRAVFLLVDVPPYTQSRNSQFLRSPKAYLVDTGLLGNLLNLDESAVSGDQRKLDLLIQTFLAGELKRLLPYAEMRCELKHLRTIRQKEVPFVFELAKGDIFGVSFTASSSVTSRHIEGLRFLKEIAGGHFRRGMVLYLGGESKPLDENIQSVPIASLWTPA